MEGAVMDEILLEARDATIQLEQFAIDDLAENIDGYLEPNWKSRQVINDWRSYVASNGRLTEDQYRNFRDAFTETRGRSNKVFSDTLARYTRKSRIDVGKSMFAPLLGLSGDDETSNASLASLVEAAARHLETYSWWKLDVLAPDAMVRSLKDKLDRQMLLEHKDKVELAYAGKDGAPLQIKVHSAEASTYEELYELSGDPLLRAIVQRYLGVPPIFNTPVAFLNSSTETNNAKSLSEIAQLYHHDIQRIGFVKMFIYLTDVDEGAGPHTLIQKTHRTRPKDALWSGSRHSDATISQSGLVKDEVRITGKAGTVFLVDTSCLHKGAHPERSSRLMAQVQYANSLFGKPIAQSDHKIELAQRKSNDKNMMTASLVRRYAEKAGVRFMQNYI